MLNDIIYHATIFCALKLFRTHTVHYATNPLLTSPNPQPKDVTYKEDTCGGEAQESIAS